MIAESIKTHVGKNLVVVSGRDSRGDPVVYPTRGTPELWWLYYEFLVASGRDPNDTWV